MAPDRVMMAATSFASATPRFAARATTTVRTFPVSRADGCAAGMSPYFRRKPPASPPSGAEDARHGAGAQARTRHALPDIVAGELVVAGQRSAEGRERRGPDVVHVPPLHVEP